MNKILQKLDTVGLLVLVAGALRYTVTNVWDRWTLALFIAGSVLVVAGIAANYRQIMTALGKRSTKYATNYVVSVILVIALVSGLNFLGKRHAKRFDLTAGGQYSLAPQTLQVLDQLVDDLEIKAFFPGGSYPPLEQLLTEYRTRNRRLQFEFIDPDKRPDTAAQFGVTVYGTFTNPFTGTSLKSGTAVLFYGERQEKIEKRSEEIREEDITNAIIKVQRQESKKIYFVLGHGEKDPGVSDRGGYAAAKKALEEQGYEVGTVNLVSQGGVPPDARVLVMAGPTAEPFEQELEFMDTFLKSGGGLLLMVDPSPAASLSPFLKAWGVVPHEDVVLDVSGAGRLMGAGPSIPLVMQYEGHRITDRFNQMTYFPYARSLEIAGDKPEGISIEPVLKANPNSWGETDLKSSEANFDEKSDIQGPLNLALAVSREPKAPAEGGSPPTARMVVVGDSDFAAVPSFQSQGNGNLFLNMVSWLSQDEGLISIRPKSPQDRRVVLTQSQQSLLRIITVFLLPGAVLAAGIIVWARRRR